jgi:hypothetical protein
VIEIETKLILVEGPPCAGKIEAARFIADMLSDAGRSVALFDENETEHPAEYAFHAHMTEEQIAALAPEERRQLYAESVRISTGYIIPLTKISVSLFPKVLPYKIYDKLDWESELPVILERWRSFSLKAGQGDQVYVFTGSLLRNLVGETMMRYDFPGSVIQAHLMEIYRLIETLDPAIVFLGSDDIAARINEVTSGRKAAWLSGAITQYAGQNYAKHRSLKGFDGYVECLRARQETELLILDEMPIRKLILADAGLDWDGAFDAIAAFIAGITLQKCMD